MSDKLVEVKVVVLEVISKATTPLTHRLDSLLADYYKREVQISPTDLAVILEFRSAMSTLSLLLEDYLEQAEEFNVTTLHLPIEEFQALMTFSRTAELAFRVSVCNTGLWSH
jgi:hypothetical protein